MNKDPITVEEAMRALSNLYDSGLGRALPTFDKERETRARVEALLLIERHSELKAKP